MPRLVRVALLVFALIIFVAGFGAFLSYRLLHKSLPQTSGELKIEGVSRPVRIFRDSFGAPHIFAENEADLYFASGYVHAQERLWQMDLYRRVATGTLSEIIGERALFVDKFIRLVGIPRISSQIKNSLSEQSLFILKNYTHGVNAFLQQNQNRLPPEFTILNYRPHAWKIEHSIAIQRLLALSLEMGWFVDPAFAVLQNKISPQKLREILPEHFEKKYADMPGAKGSSSKIFAKILDVGLALKKFTGIGGAGCGSNGWVVSGDRTRSGKPLLANDPHLWLQNPSIWYEVQLHSPQVKCAGFTIPGLPGIVIGQNQSLAWGLTNLMADGCDYFQERIHPADSLKYFYQNRWRQMDVVIDTIFVKGKKPFVQITRRTKHGPLISDLDSSLTKLPFSVSVHWTGREASDEFLAFDKIMKAGNWEQFVDGLRDFAVPPQNFLYADTAGNIGYYAAGAVPVRKRGRGILLKPGWDQRFDWQGKISFEQLPHWINPDSGMIISANQKMVDNRYPFFISDYWEPKYRFRRIWQMLSSQEKVSVENFKKMQRDRHDLHAEYLMPFILPVLGNFDRNDSLRNYFYRSLKTWDRTVSEKSVGAAIFEVFLTHFYENIFRDEMGGELYKKFVQLPNIPIRAVDGFIDSNDAPWFDDVSSGEIVETRDDIILRSLNQTFDFLAENYSKNVRQWRWGNVHRLELKHLLGQKKPLDSFFNIRSFPIGGSNTTVNAGVFPFSDKKFAMTVGASMRQIVDFSRLNEPWHVLPTGQCGNPLSEHYSDQTQLWRGGKYRRLALDSLSVATSASDLLTLVPQK
ncbi:MAG: penicillin acylase family protein [Calditrichaeota bacterium]|nr:penicillin acylase family protein [Calditrichota bacterium]